MSFTIFYIKLWPISAILSCCLALLYFCACFFLCSPAVEYCCGKKELLLCAMVTDSIFRIFDVTLCSLTVPMATDSIFDVIVIGAGVEGSATAYQLTKLAKKKRIALVEQVGSWSDVDAYRPNLFIQFCVSTYLLSSIHCTVWLAICSCHSKHMTMAC